MQPVRRLGDQFVACAPSNEVLLRDDGEVKATLATILHESWSDQDRAAFGVYVVEIAPPSGERWDGTFTNVEGAPVPVYVDIVISAAQVVAERERRLALGFDYDFGDERGVHRIGTTAADMVGWQEVTMLAQARVATASTAPIGIVTDTGPAAVTPLEWMAILEASAAVRQPIWAKSFLIAAMSPIPLDYADDSYWT